MNHFLVTSPRDRPSQRRPISGSWEAVQKRTTGTAWVSLWAGRQIWHYLAIWVCGLWATTRIWTKLNLQTRYLLLALPLLGVLSVPASWFFLEWLRWPIAAQVVGQTPSRTGALRFDPAGGVAGDPTA